MSDLRTAMSGAINNELKDFTDKQSDLIAKADDYKNKIQELSSKKYLTKAQQDELQATKDGLAEVNKSLDENAKAHEDATRRILFGYAEQQLAVGGLTENEIKALDSLAVAWGLKSQEDINAMQTIRSAASDLANDGNIDVFKDRMNNAMMGVSNDLGNAAMHAEQLKRRVDELHDKTITIKVNYHEQGSVPEGHTGGGGGYAAGTNFIVPPGYPNDSYPLRVQSGERVTVTPAAQVTNNKSTSIGGATLHITNNITATPGMDVNALADQVSQKITRKLRAMNSLESAGA